jgi:DNA-binding NarL/FixJ family response regulator
VAEGAIRRGFHGYITKDIPIDRFATSILAVLDGQLVMPHHLATVFTGAQTEAERHASALATLLTARERYVQALLVEGVSSLGIAARLSISSNTVRSHIQSILPSCRSTRGWKRRPFAVRHGLQRGSATAR